MKDNSIFGSDPEQIDRLLAWPFNITGEDGHTAALEQFTEAPGGRIGHYTLLRLLGEGGMGMVYLAEQQQPIRRKVALKVIKPGMDSKRVISRFEAEQQALALMDHPHVARVYDAGLAPSGRPYFAMEYVKGVSITAYCGEHRLTVEARLKLFLKVCEAVQHAHQKAIIHRDLKPSNILVIDQGDKSIPKVIDFGIARAIDRPLTGCTLCTEQGQLIGTPEYMSPEQASPDHRDIDTRSDIYSLGVLLYELLTGVLPFDRETFRTGGIDRIRRVICEQDPRAPSTRLRQLQASHKSKIAPDLDWIALKALAKERQRRYATVEAFAADIGSYLNHQPVSAAPPSALYRAKKFVRRHRQAVSSLGGFLILLAVLLWALQTNLRSVREYRRFQSLAHEQQLQQAQDAFGNENWDKASKLISPLFSSPVVGGKAQLLQAQLVLEQKGLAAALPELQALITLDPNTAGQAHFLLANIYHEGDPCAPGETQAYVDKWKHHSRAAEELIAGTAQYYFLQAKAAADCQEKLRLLGLALDIDKRHYDSLRERVSVYSLQGDYDRMLFDAACMRGIRPDNPEGYLLCAQALRQLGRWEEALSEHQEAIALAPDDPRCHEERWKTYIGLDNLAQALADIKQCIRLQADNHAYLVKLFLTLTKLGRHTEAEAIYQQFLKGSGYTDVYQVHWIGGYPKTMFEILTAKEIGESLHQGKALYPPGRPGQGPTSLAVTQAETLHIRMQQSARRIVPRGFHGSWSPDGTRLVHSAGMFRSSAIAILDTDSGRSELLAMPGKDPAWSPDGRFIAFVRIRQLLPFESLTGRTMQTFTYNDVLREQGEIWIMDLRTRDIRYVARGDWPQWGHRSGDLYYVRPMEGNLYRISLDDPSARPQPVLSGCSWYPAISPDERYVADNGTYREMRITDLTTRQVVHQWVAPPITYGGLLVSWSPDGQALGVGGLMTSLMGFWIYDLQTGQVRKVMDGPVGDVSWTRGPRNRLSMTVLIPYVEIWMAELKPGLATLESFAATQTVQEHCQALIEQCNHKIAADPNNLDPYHIRVDAALWIQHERASEYLQAFAAALTKQPFFAQGCNSRAQTMLDGSKELYTPLLPLVLLLARKAVEQAPENVNFLSTLGKALICSRELDSAETVLLKAYTLLDRIEEENDLETQRVVRLLTQLYESWGRPVEAKTWKEKLSAQ